MTNREINEVMKGEVRRERRATVKILKLIALAEDQKLDLELGYPNIAAWLIKEHLYSEPAARRRISAAQIYRSVPDVEEKIESGALNLSSLRQAQSAIRFHEINSGAKLSNAKKAEVVSRIENKTGDQTERELVSMFPDLASRVKQERVTVIDEKTSRLAGNLSNEAMANLKRVAELLSHKMPNASQFEVIGYLAEEYLKRNDPLLKTVKVKRTKKAAPSQKNGRTLETESVSPSGQDDQKESVGHLHRRRQSDEKHPGENLNRKSTNADVGAIAPCDTVSAADVAMSVEMKRRLVLQKAEGGCEFCDPLTGRRCGSRDRIQIDHVQPKAIGGTDDIENLRALCQRHNLYMAERDLGFSKANEWRQKGVFG